MVSCEHIEEHAAYGIYVRTVVYGVAGSLLRTHISVCAEYRARYGVAVIVVKILGYAEVQQADAAVRAHHDVRRLDVAVHDV